jgi:hypothetical protein
LPAAATIIRGVVYCPCQNACNVSRSHAADRLLGPDHRAAERVVAEQGLVGQLAEQVVRVVVAHRDLFEHHAALDLDVGVLQRRVR